MKRRGKAWKKRMAGPLPVTTYSIWPPAILAFMIPPPSTLEANRRERSIGCEVRGPEAGHAREDRVLRGVLALLRGPAPAPGEPGPALRGNDPGAGLGGARRLRVAALAPGHALRGLHLRLDRPLPLRAEPAGHIHLPALVAARRLPDVSAHLPRPHGPGDPPRPRAVPGRRVIAT